MTFDQEMTLDKPLRICILTSDFLPNTGGIAAHVAGLARGLLAVGCEILVCVPTQAPTIARMGISYSEESGIQVARTRFWGPRPLGKLFWVRAHRHFLNSILAKFQADVIHWHTPLAESMIVEDLPCSLRVFTNHTSQFLEWALVGKNIRQAKVTLKNADIVICPSEELADATRKVGYPTRQTHFISNGVDTERFTPIVSGSELRQKLGFRADEVVVICPRRLEKKNGVTYWIEAIPAVLELLRGEVPVQFILVGDYVGDSQYSDKENVLSAIRNLPAHANFRWLGSVPPDKMPEYFAASDLVVLPSLMEATSIAALEAMATGRVVIASKVGGLMHLIEHGKSGWLVPCGQPQALADAMANLIRKPETRELIGANARQRAEQQFGWPQIARQTLELYHNNIARVASAHQRS